MKYNYQLNRQESARTFVVNASFKEKELPRYFYTYSWDFDWINAPENNLADCYLESGHHLKLTSRNLVVDYRGKQYTRRLSLIQKTQLQFKRLMLPLIIGGIAAPLSFIAIINGIIGLWIGMAMMIVGVLLMVHGFRGSYQLRIEMPENNFSIFIDEKPKALQHFLDILNGKILKKS